MKSIGAGTIIIAGLAAWWLFNRGQAAQASAGIQGAGQDPSLAQLMALKVPITNFVTKGVSVYENT